MKGVSTGYWEEKKKNLLSSEEERCIPSEAGGSNFRSFIIGKDPLFRSKDGRVQERKRGPSNVTGGTRSSRGRAFYDGNSSAWPTKGEEDHIYRKKGR